MEFEPYTSTVEAPLDSTVKTENANGGDWQEEIYEKIKSMKDMYFLMLSDLSQKIVCELQKNFLHRHLTNEQIEKLKLFKVALVRILRFLGLNKRDIQLIHKEKLPSVEKHINFFLNPDQLRKPTSSPLQEQLPQSSMQFQQPQSLDGQTNPPMQPVQGSMEAPLDSTSQKGNTNGADWQEVVYKKIKSMKKMYFSKLSDLSQKIVRELQKNFLHQHRTNEQIEKLKMFEVDLERILRFLGLNKHDIQLIHKEKLLSVEKHINFFLNPDQLRKPTSSPLQEQLPQSSMQLQQPQSLDGQTNPSMQPVQHSMVAMQQNNLTNLQHNSLSGGVTISYSQQHMINTVQTGFSVDLGQGKPCFPTAKLKHPATITSQAARAATVADPAIKTAVPPSADAAATVSKTAVKATAAKVAEPAMETAVPLSADAATTFSKTAVKATTANVAEPVIETAVPPSADVATTFSKMAVNATAASKATTDHSTVFHAASTTTTS